MTLSGRGCGRKRIYPYFDGLCITTETKKSRGGKEVLIVRKYIIFAGVNGAGKYQISRMLEIKEFFENGAV